MAAATISPGRPAPLSQIGIMRRSIVGPRRLAAGRMNV